MAWGDANWWFGKNSVWQQSGLKESVTGSGEREGGITGFFSAFGSTLGSFFEKPEVKVEHSPDKTIMYLVGGVIAYMVLKK